MSPLTPVAAAGFGLLAGFAADLWVIRAARRENPDRGLDRHLSGSPVRRGLVPGLSALACLITALRWGDEAIVVPLLFFVPLLIALAVVDLHTRRLPNALTLPALIAAPILLGGSALAEGDVWVVLRAVVAGLLLFVLFLMIALLRPSGMGLGDVKVAGLIGLFVGVTGVGPALVAIVLASLGAWVWNLALLAAGRTERGAQSPFGPWLALGALTAMVCGPQLFDAYLGAIT